MKFRVIVIDLQDKTMDESIVSAANPIQALFNKYEDDLDGLEEPDDEFVAFHTPYLKLVEEGKWMMDLEDGLVFINHID